MRAYPIPKPKSGKNTQLAVDEIRSSEAVQVRADGTDPAYAEELAEKLENGAKLPRLKVMRVADEHTKGDYVFEGFHTLAAYKKCGKKVVPAVLYKGTYEELLIASAQSNREHENAGKRLTREDKKRAVLLLASGYKDAGPNKRPSHLAIAKAIGVSHTFVNALNPFGRTKPAETETFDLTDTSEAEDEQAEADTGVGGDGRGTPKKAAIPADPAARMFDWDGADAALGKLIRGLDAMAETYKLVHTPEVAAGRTALNTFAEHFKKWRQKHGK